MEDSLFIFMLLAALGIGPILGAIALIVARRDARRIEELENEVAYLARRLRNADAEGGPEPSPAVATGASPPPAREESAPEGVGGPFTGTPEPVPARAVSAPESVSTPEAFSHPAAGPSRSTATEAAGDGSGAAPPESTSAFEGLRDIQWERWLGVRGAAVAGGTLFALAAILLFKHAFTQGWVRPEARVGGGLASGLALLVGGHLLRRRAFRVAPGALEGAGIVALYASLWSAQRLYELIPFALAFPGMALVTALACVLAVRHRSQLVAILGLLGGFATPILLDSAEDRPFGFFGYVLFLDLGLLWVGRRARWPAVAALAALGTALLQVMWVAGRMDAERSAFALFMLGLFALVFSALHVGLPREERSRWLPAQAGGVLFPFVFALWFAGATSFGPSPGQTALLVLLLSIAGQVVALAQARPPLAVGSATAAVSFTATWVLGGVDGAHWALALSIAALASVPHALLEWRRTRSGDSFEAESTARLVLAPAAAVAAGGQLACATLAPGNVELGGAALFVALAVPTLLLVRQSSLLGAPGRLLAAGFLFGSGLCTWYVNEPPDGRVWAALLAASIAGAFAAATRGGRPLGHHAIGLLTLPATVAALLFLSRLGRFDPWLVPVVSIVVGSGFALAARGSGRSAWFGCGLVLVALLHALWGDRLARSDTEAVPGAALALSFVCALLFVLWPLASRSASPPTWRISSLASVAWLPTLLDLWHARMGGERPWIPTAALALFHGSLAFALRRRDAVGLVAPEARGTARRWSGAVAALLVAFAIAQAGAVTEGLVTLGFWILALAWLAGRDRDRHLLRLAGAVSASAVLLIANQAFSGAYRHSPALLWNAISWAHLPTVLGGLAGAAAAASLARDRADEGSEGTKASPLEFLPGLAAIVAGFAWINLSILNHFSDAARLSFRQPLGQEGDLATSLAWGLYAFALLALGTWRSSSALRWASLALFVLALGKAFLFDLSQLEGLYRVAALAGLALSLIAVSLLYQRFVFRAAPKSGNAEAEHA